MGVRKLANVSRPLTASWGRRTVRDGEKTGAKEFSLPWMQSRKIMAAAMEEVRATGYGIVIPAAGELELEEPEIIKQGGRYGVRRRAKAPSIHMIRADIQAEVSPIVGSEKQSEDMLGFLLQEFEGEPERIWQSNIFGRSFHELINEDLASKLKHMPEEARQKMQQTLEKIINEGSGGLICIIL